MTAWDEVLFSPWRPHPSSVNHYDTIAQAPGPAPDPDPAPDSAPDPDPGPDPDPDPAPDADPAPDSGPDPDPGPDRSRYSKVMILAERG